MKLTLPLLLLLTFSISCGSDGDDGGDNITVNTPPQEEEAPTPTPTPRQPRACVTTSQRTNITNMLDTLSADSPMSGETVAEIFNPDGSVDTGSFPATAFSFSRADANTWGVSYAVCTSTDSCTSSNSSIRFGSDGCLLIDGLRARNLSTSNSRVAYSVTTGSNRIQSEFLLSSAGIFRYTESQFTNNVRNVRFRFTEYSATLAGEMMKSLNNALVPDGREGKTMRDAILAE